MKRISHDGRMLGSNPGPISRSRGTMLSIEHGGPPDLRNIKKGSRVLLGVWGLGLT